MVPPKIIVTIPVYNVDCSKTKYYLFGIVPILKIKRRLYVLFRVDIALLSGIG